MFRNQYFITNSKVNTDLNFHTHQLDDLSVSYSPDLPMTQSSQDERSVLILGYAIDPFSPEKGNREIASNLVTAHDRNELIRRTERLSGRYIIVFRTLKSKIVFSDALGQRQVYYHLSDGMYFMTSSPALFFYVNNIEPRINRELLDFVKSKVYIKNEGAWIGDEFIDQRLKKVLPNHYLDLQAGRIRRKNYGGYADVSDDRIRQSSAQILQGGINGTIRRYNLMQAITAGYDSRILLAASRGGRRDISYYVFARSDMGSTSSDVQIPAKLSKKLGIDFCQIVTEPLKDHFLQLYKKEHVIPRILPKTQNIQYHYYNSRNKHDVIDVKGNGAEVLRSYYGRTLNLFNRQIDAEMLLHLAGYPGNRYFTNQVENWLSDAKEFAQQHQISIPDLFYWEQRMGNWGAAFGLEQDIAIEEFWPFNNASLLLSGLNIDIRKRTWPKYQFFKDLMMDLWPEVLSEPINPCSGFVSCVGSFFKGAIKSNAHSRYLVIKWRHKP